jgi:hypothetical protein
MAEVIQMAGWAERKAQQVADLPSLECPTCDADCRAVNQDGEGVTLYRCAAKGHRSLTWRIDAEGNMLRGAKGRRYY